MNILHVIGSMDPVKGGPCQGIRNLDKSQRKMGVIREAVCMDALDSTYLGSDSFTIHALGAGKGPWGYNKRLIPWLTKNINRFDIIIINGLWQFQSFAAWKVIRNYKNKKTPPILVMPHGMLDPYFQQAKNRRLKAVRNWLYWKLIERKVVNDAYGLLFTCETELLLARKSFKPYKPRNEFNVGYGIALPPEYEKAMTYAFEKLCPGLNGSPYLLFLSRIHPKKGADILIKTYISLFNEKTPKTEALPKLVIAGPGLDTPFGGEIQNELMKFPEINSNVYFPGMLNGYAKWGAFYGCEAFILPSHQENFGIAVAEALACSKPVLISDQVNIWREIKNGGIIGTDDLEGTKIMLEKWLKLSLAEREKMSQCAWEAYHENFESLPAATKYFNVLCKVINKTSF